jgi:hypothetical protein
MAMNQEIKKKWIEALTSGNYEQARGALCKEGKYCCLGVLSDLYIKANSSCRWEANIFVDSNNPEEMKHDFLPKRVQQWAGLDSENPHVDHKTESHSLSVLNDNLVNFKEIAERIKECL